MFLEGGLTLLYIYCISIYIQYELWRAVAMITLEHVSKKRESFYLKDISFHLPKGYIMGLIGENGSGKTTVLSLITGLINADQGMVSVDGCSILAEERKIKDEIGFVMEPELFIHQLSLEKNAKMYGAYYSKYDEEVFDFYCKEFGLEKTRKLKKCSRGEMLKFQLAFALAHAPKVLVLDEPTANFDPEFREQFYTIITKFVADGEHSVILATHFLAELDRIADYITILHKGNMLVSMEQERLKSKYRLVSGEAYKIRLLGKEAIISQEEQAFGARAMVRHKTYQQYDKALQVRVPTLEEILYFIAKGGWKDGFNDPSRV